MRNNQKWLGNSQSSTAAVTTFSSIENNVNKQINHFAIEKFSISRETHLKM